MSNLSPLQQYILKWLINRIPAIGHGDRQLLERGILWWPEWTPKTIDKAEDRRLENVWRASLCRSLARLEQRGLVIRVRGRKRARTARVRLTDEGQRVAEAIAAKIPPTG
jgi:hypothetical protein